MAEVADFDHNFPVFLEDEKIVGLKRPLFFLRKS